MVVCGLTILSRLIDHRLLSDLSAPVLIPHCDTFDQLLIWNQRISDDYFFALYFKCYLSASRCCFLYLCVKLLVNFDVFVFVFANFSVILQVFVFASAVLFFHYLSKQNLLSLVLKAASTGNSKAIVIILRSNVKYIMRITLTSALV